MRMAFLSPEGFNWSTDDYGGLGKEVQAIADGLAELGIGCERLNWDGDAAALARFEAVCMQTYFGYQNNPEAFEETLNQLDAAGVHCMNPTEVLRWNMHKGYLKELQNKGVKILPTLFMHSDEKNMMAEAIRLEGWQEVVIKPAVSAGAWHTVRVKSADIQGAIVALPDDMDWLIQPFAPEILDEGEWSFLFFGGKFSHAVQKTAKPGDFRIQHVHGGQYRHVLPPELALGQAADALATVPFETAYARVDGILREGELYVMEIELMEPFLYMLPDQDAVAHCVAAFADWMQPAQEAAA